MEWCFWLQTRRQGHGQEQGLFVWSDTPALCCPGVLQQASPCLSPALLPAAVTWGQLHQTAQRHVSINECLLPKRKPVVGWPWAALARCAALNWTAGFCCLDLQLSTPNVSDPRWGEKLMELFPTPRKRDTCRIWERSCQTKLSAYGLQPYNLTGTLGLFV